jgi:hypothetical protein
VVSFVVELSACLSTREPPVDGDPITVHSPVPGPGFPPQVAEGTDRRTADFERRGCSRSTARRSILSKHGWAFQLRSAFSRV